MDKTSPPFIRFRANPLLHVILSIIVILHVLFLLMLLISPTFVFRKKQHKPLIVKTIVLKPFAKTVALEKKNPRQNNTAASPPSPKPVQKTAEATKQQQMPKAQTPPKKEQASKTAAQKPASSPAKQEPAIADKYLGKTKQPTVKKSSSPQNRAKISDSLKKELDESIAKIENKNDKGVSKKATFGSKALAPIVLQIDTPSHELSNEAEGSSDYKDVLTRHLHQCLSLPDYGEVKIQLSLRQDGTVCKVIVLKAQSEKNKQYLESNLPRLKFPRFDGTYAGQNEQTFVLTFCNE